MNIQLLTNGDIEMSCSNKKERQSIKKIGQLMTSKSENEFIKLFLEPIGYKQIKPEDCGALTSASLITNGKDVWGDMSYQVQSFLIELVTGNTVTWTKG